MKLSNNERNIKFNSNSLLFYYSILEKEEKYVNFKKHFKSEVK